MSIDACFMYITSEYELKSNTSKNFNSTDFSIPVYNPYAGLDYKQEITGIGFAIGVNLMW